MVIKTSEQAFESVIEAALLDRGYQKRRCKDKDYDPVLGLIPRDLFDFIQASQPNMWAKLVKIYGGSVAEAKARFLKKLTNDLNKRGTLAMLRDRTGFRLDGGWCRMPLSKARASGI